ncbi:MAG: hypothetical protein EKK48_26415 [Candidatus Melainabacteria bacterium]|nr:MAG: hypothetical protein EKK48_26415 [Candidatus Melainabacteria bacterium]
MVNAVLVGLALWVILSPRVLWKVLQKRVFVFDEKSRGSQAEFTRLCRFLVQKQGFELCDCPIWSNGRQLNACLFKHPRSKLVFNFHMGRNNTLASCTSFVRMYSKFGSVFVCEPPGFGKSGGEADFLSFGNCGILTHRYLVDTLGYANDQIIPCGDSLGAAAATAEAVWAKSRALIISAAFESMVRMAKEQMPIMRIYPEWMFPAHTRLNNLENLRQFKGATLLLHGVRDELISFDHARLLQSAAPDRTTLIELDAAHRDTAGSDAETFEFAVDGFLQIWLGVGGRGKHPHGSGTGAAGSGESGDGDGGDGDGAVPRLSLIVNEKPRPPGARKVRWRKPGAPRLVIDDGKPVEPVNGKKTGDPPKDH